MYVSPFLSSTSCRVGMGGGARGSRQRGCACAAVRCVGGAARAAGSGGRSAPTMGLFLAALSSDRGSCRRVAVAAEGGYAVGAENGRWAARASRRVADCARAARGARTQLRTMVVKARSPPTARGETNGELACVREATRRARPSGEPRACTLGAQLARAAVSHRAPRPPLPARPHRSCAPARQLCAAAVRSRAHTPESSLVEQRGSLAHTNESHEQCTLFTPRASHPLPCPRTRGGRA